MVRQRITHGQTAWWGGLKAVSSSQTTVQWWPNGGIKTVGPTLRACPSRSQLIGDLNDQRVVKRWGKRGS